MLKNLGATGAFFIAAPLIGCAGAPSTQQDATSAPTIAAAQEKFNRVLPELKAEVASFRMDSRRISMEFALRRASTDINLAASSSSLLEFAAFELNSATEALRSVTAGIEQCRREMTDMDRRLAQIDQRCKTPTRIGMTDRQVELSCWGSPERVNRTETAGHVSEQWVYRSPGYLYFENGRLTAIQQQEP